MTKSKMVLVIVSIVLVNLENVSKCISCNFALETFIGEMLRKVFSAHLSDSQRGKVEGSVMTGLH